MSQTYKTAKTDFIEAWRTIRSARAVYVQKRRAWYGQGSLYNTKLYEEMRSARVASEYALARFIDCAEAYAEEVVRELGE